MSANEKYEFLVDELLICAVKSFHETQQYKLLREKLNQMDRDCGFHLTDDAREFATECFELLLDVSGRQDLFIVKVYTTA